MAEHDELLAPKNKTSKVYGNILGSLKVKCRLTVKSAKQEFMQEEPPTWKTTHGTGQLTMNSSVKFYQKKLCRRLPLLLRKHVSPLPPSSDKAKKLTHAVCEIIARDIRPISTVNDVGFLNLLKKVEPRYIVPCQTAVTRSMSNLYISEK